MGALTTWYQLAYGSDVVRTYIPLSGDLWYYDAEGVKQPAAVAAKWLRTMIERGGHADDFEIHGATGTDDIAGNPQRELEEALYNESPVFRFCGPEANISLMMKEGGKHYYGDINQYLYLILPRIFPAK